MSTSVAKAIFSASFIVAIEKLRYTRWSSNYQVGCEITYCNVLKTLEECEKHADFTRPTKVEGLCVQLQSFEFTTRLCVLENAFQKINIYDIKGIAGSRT